MFSSIFQLSDSLKFYIEFYKIFYMGKREYKYDKILCRKFGKRIYELRKNLGITQEELAFRSNISPSYMSAIERGITDSTITTVKRISKALQTDINELFKL